MMDAVVEANAQALGAGEARADTLWRRRIVVYGMNYTPEMAGVGRYTGEIAEHMASLGMDVSVITTPPHYPGWKTTGDYRNGYSTRHENGIKVHRAPLLLRQRMRGMWRLIAPLSFAVTSAPLVFWQILRTRPDIVFCVEPTLFAAPIAQLAAWLSGARTVLHVQDLEVDAAFAVGHLGSKPWLKRLGHAFERFTLSRFDTVITISNRMAEKLCDKGVAQDRLAVVRNWVDLSHIYPTDQTSPYRAELGYQPDDFVVLYSGNIGAKQGLPVLLNAAEQLKDHPRIKFVIAGEGPVKAELEACYGHLAAIRFLPFQPYARLNDFLNMADLHALPQDKGAADLVLPSKLGGMLASGKPLIVTADPGTELADFLGTAAVITPPGDARALAEGILSSMSRPKNAGAEDRARLAQQTSKSDGITTLIGIISNAN